jgi:predicted O-methyltransferase YrrM
VLLDLIDEGPEFDLIYVDGSHLGLDVLVDAALSWRLLRPGGTMVFDDYLWNDRGDDPLLRPGPAIDAVLGLLEGKVALLAKGSQVPVRKL